MISTDGDRIIDSCGRSVFFRGVNLSGSSKIPCGLYQSGHNCDAVNLHGASFLGRPFPLEEADEHFLRLKRWGFTLLRYIVTWEAIEHAGPGVYDLEYLEYLQAVIRKAGEHGLMVLIDPHQDVWSRWSGGDGAPAWTLEAVGFEPDKFEQTCAAVITQAPPARSPAMLWLVNTTKLAAATMFTLFFGGDDFAPLTRIEGLGVQEFLQKHYIDAMKRVASLLRDFDFVIGYGSMNEPMRGYIGWQDLAKPVINYDFGPTPSPFQSMLLGDGIPQKVGVWRRKLLVPRQTERRMINREELRVWKEGYDCLWRRNGVWDFDAKRKPKIVRPDYFTRVQGRDVDFPNQYLLPFIERFSREMRSVAPDALIFFEGEPFGGVPNLKNRDRRGMVFAPHWYDGLALVLKKYFSFIGADAERRKLVIGKRRVRESFKEQLGRYKRRARAELGGVPVLIGEIGISFDLDRGRAYRTGNFKKQIKAMDRSLQAAEGSLLGYAIWNYTPDNSHLYGDGWNGEDLSIFSRDQRIDPADINSGGRALEAVIRPYPPATAGIPLELSFDYQTGYFKYTFRHIDSITEPTEIFVPEFQYPNGFGVEISDGVYSIDAENQIIKYLHSKTRQEHTLLISRK
jgi:hypothetical protein